MGIVEQFQQSLFYQWKTLGEWEAQSIWKSFFYLMCLVLLSSLIVSFYSFSKTSNLNYEGLLTEMDPFVLTEQGLDYNGEPLVVPIPVFDVTIMIGDTEQRAKTSYVIECKKDGFKFGKNGLMSLDSVAYSSLPIWKNKDSYNNADVLKSLQSNASKLKQLAFFYQYVKAFLQVLISLVIVSLIALVSIPYGRSAAVSYRRLWMFGAYGLTLPLVMKTILNLTGFFIPYFEMIYWFTVVIFVFLVVTNIKRSA
ncbi:DUF1189 family protein [Listeria welshimeri]|nr:DUF1189 family protein [Listeria welshimeri]